MVTVDTLPKLSPAQSVLLRTAARRADGLVIPPGTGWQTHTVRGAISGMVRKRLGYEVVTEKGADGQRAYRIA